MRYKSARQTWADVFKDCGTGAGGFKPGNSCARGGDGDSSGGGHDGGESKDSDGGNVNPKVLDWAKRKWGDELAPNGKTKAENFAAWFGDSKVVNENGEPLIVYKGHPTKDWRTETEIESFESKNGPWAGFFTSEKEVAQRFANAFRGTNSEVYIRSTDPLIVDAKGANAREFQIDADVVGGENSWVRDAFLKGSYDCLILKNTSDEGDVFVPRNPNQIKSATGNDGNFDPAQNSIKKRFTAARAWRRIFGNSQATR